MKIAIIHDDMSVYGGSEKTVLMMAKLLGADIFTFTLTEEVKALVPADLRVTARYYEKKKDSFSWEKRHFFAQLDLGNSYDFFILSGPFSLAAFHLRPNLHYCHNIPRQAFDLEIRENFGDFYNRFNNSFLEKFLALAHRWKNKIIKKKLPGWLIDLVDFLRFAAAERSWAKARSFIKYRFSTERYLREIKAVEKIAANSENTCLRVKEICGREARVIYPPVDAAIYGKGDIPGKFWLSVNRVHPWKRIEMQIEAFRQMPEERLLIVGETSNCPDYADKLKSGKPQNVEMVGLVDDKKLIELYNQSKGLIFTALREDFGRTPVEAMAAGKPVIAPAEGGPKETVIDGLTGVLIPEIDASKICQAVKAIGENPQYFREACRQRAEDFCTQKFKEDILKFIYEK